MVKKGHYGNENFSLAWDCIEVCQVPLFITTDPKANQISYWPILKSCPNNKKIPCIPPVLHQDKSVADFREKANIFNNFFTDQCSIVTSNSKLPATITKKACESLSTINFSTDDILKSIKIIDPKKVCGQDIISIQMIKIYDTSICRPLKLKVH